MSNVQFKVLFNKGTSVGFPSEKRAIEYAAYLIDQDICDVVEVAKTEIVWAHSKQPNVITRCGACGDTENLNSTNCRATEDYKHRYEFQGV